MIASVVHIDVRAAVAYLLIRKEFSCQGLVMCSKDTSAADVGGYTLEGILSDLLK